MSFECLIECVVGIINISLISSSSSLFPVLSWLLTQISIKDICYCIYSIKPSSDSRMIEPSDTLWLLPHPIYVWFVIIHVIWCHITVIGVSNFFRSVMWNVLQEKRLQTLLKMIQHMVKITNSVYVFLCSVLTVEGS